MNKGDIRYAFFNRFRHARLMLALLALCLLLLPLPVQAQSGGPFTITLDLIASGGQDSVSASYRLQSTVGQAAAGSGSSADYTACSGYWCRAGLPAYRAYLPLSRR